MSKRLSKISRDLKIGISVIADFLNNNGYKCEEDPSETLSDELVEFVYSNIKSYISGHQCNGSVTNTKPDISNKTDNVQIPLELRIVDAASKQKKLIERIIGFTDYNWRYIVEKYRGTCSQPVDFNLFDEVICGILLKGEFSAKTIGGILGFDIETDPAEKEILLSAINDLKKDKMVDGDESVYWLTAIGREYAKNGVKFSTFDREFELYIDAVGQLKENAKDIFSKLNSVKQNNFQHENLPRNIEDVKLLAEVQAPEIHFPAKRFILQSCGTIGTECYMAKVWVILLENFRDNTVRSLVYDENQDVIIDSLSKTFDSLKDEKNKLLERLLSESDKDDFTIENTLEQKKESQILLEKELIKKQYEIEAALKNNDFDRIDSIRKEAVEVKRHFNSLEFEVELKRLFDAPPGELWIISPWIRNRATFRRIHFFENYLRKGGRIFIAYSLPENGTDNMADKEALEKLYELERKYLYFYIHQLPAFHYKRVWLRTNNGEDLYYSGSYNVLSFFVKKGLKYYRQEEMSRFDWNKENDDEYKSLFTQFSKYYLEKTIETAEGISSNGGNVKLPYPQAKLQPLLDKNNVAYKEMEGVINNCEASLKKIFIKKHQIVPTEERAMSFQKKYNGVLLTSNRIRKSGENRLSNSMGKDKIAVIELSSKAVKWLIQQVDDETIRLNPFSFSNFYRETRKTETGNGLNNSGVLDEKYFVGKVLPSIIKANFATRESGVDVVYCVATAVYRSARNINSILSIIKRETDLDVCVLTEDEEAEYTFWAYFYSVSNKEELLRKPYTLLLDQGGGSTEITLFHNQKLIFRESFDMGTTILKNDLFLQQNVSIEEGFKYIDEKYKQIILDKLQHMNIEDIPKSMDAIYCIAVGTAITAALGGGTKSNKDVHEKELSLELIQKIVEHSTVVLSKFSMTELQMEIESSKGNTQILEKKLSSRLGLPIIYEILNFFNVKSLRISGTGLWYGVFFTNFYNIK